MITKISGVLKSMNLPIMSYFLFRLLKYILPVLFLGVVLWGGSVEAAKYSIQCLSGVMDIRL